MNRAAKLLNVKPKNKVRDDFTLQRYPSRIKHANRRPRDKHGRFYKKGEEPEELSVQGGDKTSDKSKDITKASNE